MEISQRPAEQSPEREGLGPGDMCQPPNLSLPEAKPRVGFSLQVSQFGGSVCCYRHHKIRGVHGSFPFFWAQTYQNLTEQANCLVQTQSQPECIRPWIISNYGRKYILTVDEKVPDLSCEKKNLLSGTVKLYDSLLPEGFLIICLSPEDVNC